MFEGKVALVTGASAGIGLSVSRKLAALGTRVALVARTPWKLEALVRDLGAEQAAGFPVDVGDLASLEELPSRVVERFGRLDFLINNAGLHLRGPFDLRTAQELAQMVTVNLSAPIVLTRAALPHLPKGGVVVNVASLAGLVPVRDAAVYSATKAGLRAFGRAAADELRRRGIAVCSVSPGPVDTDFFGEQFDKVTPITFSQPISTPDEVADAILQCIRTKQQEIALPWSSGKLATLAYLSPNFLRLLRPMMERKGAKAKAAYAARKARQTPQR
jgi:hypothetical protein